MSNISSITSAYQNAVAQATQTAKNQTQVPSKATTETENNIEKSTKSPVSGRTIGNPKLSEKASKYYEQLKKKFGNMDFILVSADQKEAAQAQAANYANPNRPVVLIDEEKIEKMAEDEKFRKQYEGIISGASSQLAQMAGSFASSGTKVKAYGVKVNDNGTASLFAVIDKSLAAQKARIEKHAQEKKEAKRTEQRKSNREEWQNRLDRKQDQDVEDTATITASTIDELLQKIDDMMFSDRSNQVQTEEEKLIGQNINFSV